MTRRTGGCHRIHTVGDEPVCGACGGIRRRVGWLGVDKGDEMKGKKAMEKTLSVGSRSLAVQSVT